MKIISEAAMKIFARKGYYKTTVDEVAEQSGVVRGTVLHYFGCKERLFNAVLDSLGEAISEEINSVVYDNGIPVSEAVTEIIDICVKNYAALKPSEESYADDESDLYDRRYNIDSMRLRIFYRAADSLTELIERGNKEGEFNIPKPRARAESALFAVFGITGSRLEEEEAAEEIRAAVKNMLGSR